MCSSLFWKIKHMAMLYMLSTSHICISTKKCHSKIMPTRWKHVLSFHLKTWVFSHLKSSPLSQNSTVDSPMHVQNTHDIKTSKMHKKDENAFSSFLLNSATKLHVHTLSIYISTNPALNHQKHLEKNKKQAWNPLNSEKHFHPHKGSFSTPIHLKMKPWASKHERKP